MLSAFCRVFNSFSTDGPLECHHMQTPNASKGLGHRKIEQVPYTLNPKPLRGRRPEPLNHYSVVRGSRPPKCARLIMGFLSLSVTIRTLAGAIEP